MHASLRSPTVHTPQTFSELQSILTRSEKFTYFAYGSEIMRQKDSYPAKDSAMEIISLSSIEEMKRFQRNDKIAEIGAMLSLEELLSVGRSILPKILVDTIKSFGGSVILRGISIGGCLASKKLVSYISGTLIALDAQAEIKFLKRKRLHSKWYPIRALFDKDGLKVQEGAIISRIRVPLETMLWQRFYKKGDFLTESSKALALSFIANHEADTLNSIHIVMTYPDKGIIFGRDYDNIFSSVRLPLDQEETKSLIDSILSLCEQSRNLSNLQRERTKGILNDIIYELNIETLNQSLGEK